MLGPRAQYRQGPDIDCAGKQAVQLAEQGFQVRRGQMVVKHRAAGPVFVKDQGAGVGGINVVVIVDAARLCPCRPASARVGATCAIIRPCSPARVPGLAATVPLPPSRMVPPSRRRTTRNSWATGSARRRWRQAGFGRAETLWAAHPDPAGLFVVRDTPALDRPARHHRDARQSGGKLSAHLAQPCATIGLASRGPDPLNPWSE